MNQADVRVMLSVHRCFLAFEMAANITDLLPQPLAAVVTVPGYYIATTMSEPAAGWRAVNNESSFRSE